MGRRDDFRARCRIFAALWEARRASTRVDSIPARVRAPLGERRAPPPVSVLSLSLDACERHPLGLEGVLSDLLYAVPPGWVWELLDPAESGADAIACARSQATLRGDVLEVMADEVYGVTMLRAWPLVVVVPGGGRRAPRQLVIVVVRFLRESAPPPALPG